MNVLVKHFIDEVKKKNEERMKKKNNCIDMNDYFKPSNMKEKYVWVKRKYESQN
jgi:hypothetical protein